LKKRRIRYSGYPEYANRNDRPWRETGPRELRAPILEVALVDGALLVENESGATFRSVDGATWAPAPAKRRPPPDEGTVVEATAPDGVRWRSTERYQRVTYDENPGYQFSLMHTAWVVERAIDRSTDGGATWTRARDDMSASAFVFDERGRTWVAGSSGLHVVGASGARWRKLHPDPAVGVVLDGERVVLATTQATFLSRDGGDSFAAIDRRCVEYGEWGSAQEEVWDPRRLLRAPDGAAWTITSDRAGDGVFRLAPPSERWESINFGLHAIPGAGRREGHLGLTALAFLPSGTAFVGTSAGLFRRG